MGKTSRQTLAAGFLLAVTVNFCLFALIPYLAQHETIQELPLYRQPVRLFRELPPEPDMPQKPVKEMEEQKPLQTPQPLTPARPNLIRSPELDFRMPDLSLQLATSTTPAPVSAIADSYAPEDLDIKPALSYQAPPVYPYRARRMSINGQVRIQFEVATDGSVRNVRILQSEPAGVFDQAVLDAVRTWRFRPGELLGEQVVTRMARTIVFNLED